MEPLYIFAIKADFSPSLIFGDLALRYVRLSSPSLRNVFALRCCLEFLIYVLVSMLSFHARDYCYSKSSAIISLKEVKIITRS